jgi:hypothetical protein
MDLRNEIITGKFDTLDFDMKKKIFTQTIKFLENKLEKDSDIDFNYSDFGSVESLDSSQSQLSSSDRDYSDSDIESHFNGNDDDEYQDMLKRAMNKASDQLISDSKRTFFKVTNTS